MIPEGPGSRLSWNAFFKATSLPSLYLICYFISDIMDYFLAGNDQPQTNQPLGQAGGLLVVFS